ncbi:MAG: CBS domain-containing protein [Gammaproteobacteria bacterium]|nr:CBS domain-containing protein [Gammaproteobacteria bacterium]
MKDVTELLLNKGQEIWSVGLTTPVFDALKLMADKNIGAVIVMDGTRLAGILSERDYARKVILRGKSSKDTPVSEIMSWDVISVNPSESIDGCMGLMTEKRIRHLPVLDNGDVVGVISISDVVEAVISDQDRMIGQLERYITANAEIP